MLCASSEERRGNDELSDLISWSHRSSTDPAATSVASHDLQSRGGDPASSPGQPTKFRPTYELGYARQQLPRWLLRVPSSF